MITERVDDRLVELKDVLGTGVDAQTAAFAAIGSYIDRVEDVQLECRNHFTIEVSSGAAARRSAIWGTAPGRSAAYSRTRELFLHEPRLTAVKHLLTVTLPTLALLLVACSAIGGQASGNPPSLNPSSSPTPTASPTATAAPSAPASTQPSTSPSTGLDGRQFVSVTVEKNGALQPLVPGTRIRLTFTGGNLSATVGCNTMSGDYSLSGDKLVVGELATTEMGCQPDLQAQDTWLAGLLTAHPQFALQGSNLILASGTTVVTLLDRAVAEPDQPLVGITWGLTSIIDGDIASSVPEGASATILFTADGQVQFDSGCNAGGGQYTVDGDSLHFAQIVSTTMACPDPRGSVESAVRAVLDGDPIKFSIDGTTLTLSVGDKSLQYDAAVDVTPTVSDSLYPR